MTRIDLLKTIFTYSIAIIVVVGGGLMVAIYGNVMDKLVVGAVIGFMGMALNWTFGETTRSSTARQTTRALMTQAPTGGPTYTTSTESGDVSVTPEAAPEKKP